MEHAWQLTDDIRAFLAAADDYLRSDPVRNTVPLSVRAGRLESGLAAYGDAAPLFGWQQALESGAAEVVLCTDLANPASNALYQRSATGPSGIRLTIDLR